MVLLDGVGVTESPKEVTLLNLIEFTVYWYITTCHPRPVL